MLEYVFVQIHLKESSEKYQIERYSPGEITINSTPHHQSLIVKANKLHAPWRPKSLENVCYEDWSIILEWQPEILLLGTGLQFKMARPQLLAPLINAQIGVECMDTHTACHHYIALNADGRDVVAALLIE